MEMQSSRRPPFDRSREQLNSIKKPRLAAEDPRQRPQPPEPSVAGAVARYRASNASSGAGGGGGGALQQYQQNQELVNQYKTALAELTFNSKPIITNLTIIAGENLLAARAIAATICAHILEVPSEQKLPSLYLLDSIVKNIGRDYIKYFATRLPEVFCKAYRHVDPATHQSMRHLFGTWKGVFPLQQLQIIEKELGFSAAVNGSLSGSATSKTNSQSQRQPNSIHVNPKYLAARRLQQTNRPKGSNIDGADLESSEVVERPDRTASTGIGRVWTDPSVKNIQRPQRETNLQKQVSLGYGDFVPSGLKRPLSSSVGKPTGQGYEKRWLGASEDVEDSPSTLRNGFDTKRGILSAGMRSASSLMKNPARNSVEVSKSWKNSEEEEYMWDDLGVGATDSGAVEKLEYSSHPTKWQSQPDVRSSFDRELSTDSLSSEPKEHVPFLNPRSSSSALNQGGNRSVIAGPSAVGVSSFGVPTAVSGSRQSVINQCSPSPLFSKRDPRQSLAEKNFLKSQSLGRTDPRAPAVSGQLNPVSHSSAPSRQQNALPGTVPLPKLSSSVGPSLHQRLYVPSSEKVSNSEAELSGIVQKAQEILGSSSLSQDVPSDSLNLLHGDLHGQSSVSNLLAAVMKAGILSGPVSGQVGVRPPPKTSLTSPGATSTDPEDSATLSVSHRKGDELALSSEPLTSSAMPSTLPETSNKGIADSNPFSILSTLISKGLISAPKTEETVPSSMQCENLLLEESPKVAASTSISVMHPVPKSSPALPASTKDKISSSEPVEKGLDIVVQSAKYEVDDLIGLDFRPRVIREFHSVVIDRLSENHPHRCTECGVCFKLQEALARHFEWHALKNSLANCLDKPSRRWYPKTSSWVDGKVGFPFGYGSSSLSEGSSSAVEVNEENVPADESQCVCLLCGELFEEFYCQETDEWMFKGAVYMPILSGSTDRGPSSEADAQNMIVHANCMSEEAVRNLGLFSGIKVEKTM